MKLKEMALTDGDLRDALEIWLDLGEEEVDAWDLILVSDPSSVAQQVVDAINGYLDVHAVNAAGDDGRESVDLTYVTNLEGHGVEGFEFAYVLHPDERRRPALRLGSMFYEPGDFLPKSGGMEGAMEVAREVLVVVNTAIRAYNDFAGDSVISV